MEHAALPRSQRNLLIALMIGMYLCSYFQRVSVPGPIFGILQETFRLSAVQVAGLGTFYLLTYAALQPLSGAWADRFGGAFLIAAGGLVLTLGAFCFAASPTPKLLYLGRILTALGDGVMYLALVKEIDRYFRGDSFAFVLSLACVLSGLGALGATVPFRMTVDAVGWRATFAGVALFTLAVYAAYLAQGRRCGALHPRHHNAAGGHGLIRAFRIAAMRRINYPIMAALSCAFGIAFVIQVVIGVKFLTDRQNLAPAAAAGCILVMLIFSLCWMAAAPAVSRFFGNNRRGFLIAGTAAALTAAVILFAGAFWELPRSVILFALCCAGLQGGNVGVTTAQLRELNPPEIVATVIGLLNTFTYLMISLLAALSGWLLDRFGSGTPLPDGEIRYSSGGYATVFLLFIAVAGAGLFAALKSRETHGRRTTERTF